MNIILASKSPRRQQLLKQADIDFTTLGVDVDETVLNDELPQDYILRMVRDKAQAACDTVFSNVDDSRSIKNNENLIITSDTIGVLPDGKSILVKPTDKMDAFNMWSKLSDSSHNIWTAVQLTVVNNIGKVLTKDTILEKTEVTFIPLTQQKMDDYWETGEPQDKAGGYAIQGKGAAWVKRISGSYTNVVGLPLAQTLEAIEAITNKISSN